MGRRCGIYIDLIAAEFAGMLHSKITDILRKLLQEKIKKLHYDKNFFETHRMQVVDYLNGIIEP